MQNVLSLRRAIAFALVFGAAFALIPGPARADVAVDAGATVSGSRSSAAGALSLGLFNVPLVPLAGQLTVAVPVNGGYATTFDARLSFAGTTLGAGAGFGTLGLINRAGTIYDAILAHAIAPRTALEARMYFGPARPSTLFAGLRFSL